MINKIQDQAETLIDDDQHIQYSIDFTRSITALEAQLHSCEDPAVIAMDALRTCIHKQDGLW